MMECDEVIHYIEEAELALETLRTFWAHKRKPAALAVAAFAFAHMQQHAECESEDIMTQCQALFRLAVWVSDLRCGLDPRCDLCKQGGELKSNSQHAIPEVVQ